MKEDHRQHVLRLAKMMLRQNDYLITTLGGKAPTLPEWVMKDRNELKELIRELEDPIPVQLELQEAMV